MTSAFEIEREESPHTRIKVVGVGGAGTNAVDYMLKAGIQNVDFAVVNTDARVLERSTCPSRIQIGEELTGGLGAGGNPELGYQSAEASADKLAAAIDNTDMLFVSAGMGGGTGTGATPVVARLAREKGILTVAIVTKPFRFEGKQRMRKAEAGLERLREFVDTLIVISNDRLLEVVGRKTSLLEAFGVTNDILSQSVKSISNLISTPGLINVDFADIRTIMRQKGGAVMGVARAKGENRATEAVKKASSSSLLDKMAIDGAQGVLVCITGGADLTLFEIDEAMSQIYQSIDEDADIIFGAVIDEKAGDEIQITLIATGFENQARAAAEAQAVQPSRAAASQRSTAASRHAATAQPQAPAQTAARPAPAARQVQIPASRVAAEARVAPEERVIVEAPVAAEAPEVLEDEMAADGQTAQQPAVALEQPAPPETLGESLKRRLSTMMSGLDAPSSSGLPAPPREAPADLWAEIDPPASQRARNT